MMGVFSYSCSHDTPSRIPLIWRPPDASHNGAGRPSGSSSAPHQQATPSVPALVVLLVFTLYICAGAAAFASMAGWTFLDAVYFCFLALATIGVGERLPQGSDTAAQMQLFAWCAYLFVGLAVVAMCFGLVHEEVALRCRQMARLFGLTRR